MVSKTDPRYVSKARKKELDRLLEAAFERYPIERALKYAERRLEREEKAAAR